MVDDLRPRYGQGSAYAPAFLAEARRPVVSAIATDARPMPSVPEEPPPSPPSARAGAYRYTDLHPESRLRGFVVYLDDDALIDGLGGRVRTVLLDSDAAELRELLAERRAQATSKRGCRR